MARVIQVIETEITRGDGRETLLRGVKQYWTFDGELLAENDPCPGDAAKVRVVDRVINAMEKRFTEADRSA